MGRSLSRVLVKVLRHSAKSVGLDMDDDGFVEIQDILDHDLFKDLDYKGLMNIVQLDQKSRFEVVGNKIRASQGHSVPINIIYPLYTDCTLPLFHGTYRNKLKDIIRLGLSKMNRNYIHLTNNLDAVSGVRSNCDVYIYINMEMAMNDGIVFYKSSNGVILTDGIDGVIPSNYFLKITTKQGDLITEAS